MTDEQSTILIIEDEWSMRSVLVDRFELEEYKVLESGDGEEGLKIALDQHPDVILLDIIMPKMDGITMLKELRKDKWGKDAKVIFLSNLSSDNQQVRNLEKDKHADYLVKIEWTLDRVVEKVDKTIRKK